MNGNLGANLDFSWDGYVWGADSVGMSRMRPHLSMDIEKALVFRFGLHCRTG